jgi:hypothetical protein
MSDYKERYPLWPSRNNRPLLLTAAWMAFGVIFVGTFQVIFVWLFDLVMDRVIGTEWARFHADYWRTFLLGASLGGAVAGWSIAWSWWREPKISNRE